LFDYLQPIIFIYTLVVQKRKQNKQIFFNFGQVFTYREVSTKKTTHFFKEKKQNSDRGQRFFFRSETNESCKNFPRVAKVFSSLFLFHRVLPQKINLVDSSHLYRPEKKILGTKKFAQKQTKTQTKLCTA